MKTLRIAVAFVSMFALTFATACGDDDGGTEREICNNLTDDDGDGLTDCADSDCINAANCQVGTEICNNMQDDDGDNLTDCDDPDCASNAACQGGTEICNNMQDDDGDNLTDCDDPDCATNAACQGGGTCTGVADLIAQDGCDANQKCSILDQNGTIGCTAAGSAGAWQACGGGGTDDCQAGMFCSADMVCVPFCDDTLAPCPTGATCSISLEITSGGPTVNICDQSDSCDPVDYDVICGTGEGCYITSQAGDTSCFTAGSATAGGSCQYANDCAAGYACLTSDQTNYFCEQLCKETADCAAGTCEGIGQLFTAFSDIGVCQTQ